MAKVTVSCVSGHNKLMKSLMEICIFCIFSLVGTHLSLLKKSRVSCNQIFKVISNQPICFQCTLFLPPENSILMFLREQRRLHWERIGYSLLGKFQMHPSLRFYWYMFFAFYHIREYTLSFLRVFYTGVRRLKNAKN